MDKGLPCLYSELQKSDPDTAAKVSSNDKQRILRALEVLRATGIPISTHWKNQVRTGRYQTCRFYLEEDRDVLYKRINQRVLKMLDNGLLEEIASVLEMGYNWNAPGFNTVGYKEFKEYFRSSNSLAQCTELAQQHTRNYAKRQITWYKKCTFDLSGRQNQINIKYVAQEIRKYLLI